MKILVWRTQQKRRLKAGGRLKARPTRRVGSCGKCGLGIVAAFLAITGCVRMPPPLPMYGQIPAFELTSETGQPFHREALDGKVWVADFIFTTCTGPCPRLSSLMHNLQQSVISMPDVRLVSFSVDPERDTPTALAQYAVRYHAQPERWKFLTGPRDSLDRLTRNDFKLGNVDGKLIHSTRFVLLDRQSRIRGYYGTSEDDPVNQLVRDIKRVLAERS
jgi:protein SCO1